MNIFDHRVLIIEGLPGSGKTTLARHLTKVQNRIYLTTFPNRKENGATIAQAGIHWPTAHIEQLLTIQQIIGTGSDLRFVLDRGMPTACLYNNAEYGAVLFYRKLMRELDAFIIALRGSFTVPNSEDNERFLSSITDNFDIPFHSNFYSVQCQTINESLKREDIWGVEVEKGTEIE